MNTQRSWITRSIKLIKHLVGLIAIRLDPESWIRRAGVHIGTNCRFYAVKPGTFGSEPYLISIGDHVTVTDGVKFITHDGGLSVFREQEPKLEFFAPISIGNNVFIGVNSIIMPGAVIGSHSVVAAGTVVSGKFPDGVVIAGTPARVLFSTNDYYNRKRPRSTTEIHGLRGSERRRALEELLDFKPPER